MADAGAASAVEQPASALGEGSAALVRVRPEPYGWDHPCVWWRSRDDPEGEPIFALEDVAEGGRWDTLEQYRSLAEQSLRTALSVVANDLPGSRRYVSPFSRVTSSFSGFTRSAQLMFCLSRSSRPDLSGSRCSFGGRGASGTSSVGRGSCLPTPTSFCRHGAWRRRISVFAVTTGRLRRPRLRGRSPLWRHGSRSWRRN